MVSCPVDAEVYNTDGKLAATAKDGEESSGHTEDVYYYVRYQKLDEDYVKILCFPEDSGYTFEVQGEGYWNSRFCYIKYYRRRSGRKKTY